MRTCDLVVLWENKDAILAEPKDKVDNQLNLELKVIYITKLLWEIGKKPRGIIKRYQFRNFFFKYCYNNVEALFKVFNDMLDYQTRLFFLLQRISSKIITQQKEYSETSGDLFSQEAEALGPKYTSNIFLNASTAKKAKNTESNQLLKYRRSYFQKGARAKGAR